MTDEVERVFEELSAIKRPNHGPEYPLKSVICIMRRWAARVGAAALAISLCLLLAVANGANHTWKTIALAVSCFTMLAGAVLLMLAMLEVGLITYCGWRDSDRDALRNGRAHEQCARRLLQFDVQSLETVRTWLQCEIEENNRHRNWFFGGAVSLLGLFELLTNNTDISYQALWNFSGPVRDLGFSQVVSAIQFFMVGAAVGGLLRMHLTNKLSRQKMWVDMALQLKRREASALSGNLAD